MIDILHHLLETVVAYGILFFEFSGLAIILACGIKGFYFYIKKSDKTRLRLARGLELGLEFKLGGEILRTVVVREWSEILTVGSIIILRALLTFLIHWEIQNEEVHNGKEEDGKN